jgi:hypothetical protein
MWNLWKFTRNFRNVKRLLSQIFWSTLWKRSSRPTTSLLIVDICSPIFDHSTLFCYCSFNHWILAANCATFTTDFRTSHVFSMKKADNSANFAAAGLSTVGHIIIHSVETRTNTRWPVIWWFTRQWVMWRYLAWASPPWPLHYLPKINGCFLA